MSETSNFAPKAWEVKRVLPDGTAERYDGHVLKPREKNPWYVLATIFGEHDGLIDDVLAANNRQAWNSWMHYESAGTVQSAMVSAADFERVGTEPWSSLRADIIDRFRRRTGFDEVPPNLTSHADLSGLYNPNASSFRGFVFPGRCYFEKAHFRDKADFTEAVFLDECDFREARWESGSTLFEDVAFHGMVRFSKAVFHQEASFRRSDFRDFASFERAAFCKWVDFGRTNFHYAAVFCDSDVQNEVSFRSTRFGDLTDFRGAVFRHSAPMMHSCELYQDARFSYEPRGWPEPQSDTAEDDKSSYARLRQLMNELHRPDEEYFFLRREMRCKALLDEPWERIWTQLYGVVSDYGYSVWRPILALLVVVTVGWLLIVAAFAWNAVLADGTRTGWEALGLSFANTFSFLGFSRLYFGADYVALLPAWMKVLGALQTILGVIFLFFLGLGLRNRFRLR